MTSVLETANLRASFMDIFGSAPRLYRAPGRINIIGEHVDYAGGKVLPAAIDFECLVAAARNDLNYLRVHSDLGQADIALDHYVSHGDWRDYVAGVAFALRDAGFEVGGYDLVLKSTVPIGAGVSSSAALEVAIGLALSDGTAIGPQLALIAQASENKYVGMACGIMDQYASACGLEGHALLLDCAKLEATPIELPTSACFLVVDSGVKHAHTTGGYASRRADCESAAAQLGVKLLCEISDVSALSALSGTVLKRARHVVSEIQRTSEACTALLGNDLAALGALMNQSHASLSTDMEVSTPEVDQLVDIAQSCSGVYGARMMGGGFGGSIIALVDPDQAASAQDFITKTYGLSLGRIPDAFIVRAAQGAGELL